MVMIDFSKETVVVTSLTVVAVLPVVGFKRQGIDGATAYSVYCLITLCLRFHRGW